MPHTRPAKVTRALLSESGLGFVISLQPHVAICRGSDDVVRLMAASASFRLRAKPVSGDLTCSLSISTSATAKDPVIIALPRYPLIQTRKRWQIRSKMRAPFEID